MGLVFLIRILWVLATSNFQHISFFFHFNFKKLFYDVDFLVVSLLARVVSENLHTLCAGVETMVMLYRPF